jgi:hypothetical protein
MRMRLTLFGLLMLAMALIGGAMAADKLSDLQAKFDRENKGVSKAKLLEKLGDEQILAARAAGHQGDYSTAGLILEKYRDNGRAAVEALTRQQADAERHPNGFRQAEMALRRGIREVDEMLLVAPDVYRPPLQIVRRDLIDLNDQLLRALFPRRAEPSAAPPQKFESPETPPKQEKNR